MCYRTFLIALGLILVIVMPTDAFFKAQAFHNLGCRGELNTSIFYRVERICDDCFNLFHAPGVLVYCRLVRREVAVLNLFVYLCIIIFVFLSNIKSNLISEFQESLLYKRVFSGLYTSFIDDRRIGGINKMCQIFRWRHT